MRIDDSSSILIELYAQQPDRVYLDTWNLTSQSISCYAYYSLGVTCLKHPLDLL